MDAGVNQNGIQDLRNKKVNPIMTTKAVLIGLTGLIVAGATYAWYFVSDKPLDEIVVYATSARYPVWMRWAADARLARVRQCPKQQFGPATPLSFLVAAMGGGYGDAERTRQVFITFQEAGCDINAREQTGLAPLHTAILFKNASAVTFLLGRGADVNIKITGKSDLAGRNALEFARYVCEKDGKNCGAIYQALGMPAGK